jgi:Protein of unknown function (DUF1566)
MQRMGMGLLLCGLLFCTPAVWADQKARVPQTGQTTTYDSDTPPRDDGALQTGVTLPIPRFAGHGDGTIKDNLTGLIWLRKADCAFAGRTWQQSLDDVASLNATGTMNGHDCGDTSNDGTHQTDWRLPNIRELNSLVHYGFFQPALSNPAGTAQAQCLPVIDCPFSFSCCPDIGLTYWSSTTRFAGPVDAWAIDLTEGNERITLKTDQAAPGTLAVRGRRTSIESED